MPVLFNPYNLGQFWDIVQIIKGDNVKSFALKNDESQRSHVCLQSPRTQIRVWWKNGMHGACKKSGQIILSRGHKFNYFLICAL